VKKVSDLKKWFLRSFMLLLVLAAYGGTAFGNRNLIKLAEAARSEGETFVFHEISETRRESANPKRQREHRHGEIRRKHTQPDVRFHGWFWFVNNHFEVRKDSGPPSPPRAPPTLS